MHTFGIRYAFKESETVYLRSLEGSSTKTKGMLTSQVWHKMGRDSPHVHTNYLVAENVQSTQTSLEASLLDFSEKEKTNLKKTLFLPNIPLFRILHYRIFMG